AQAILPLLESDLVEAVEATLGGRLDSFELKTRPGASVVAVAAAEGYPFAPRLGDPSRGLADAKALLGERGAVFHAGTRLGADGRILVSGGRVLGVAAWGEDAESASERARSAIEAIHWP